MGIGIYTVYIIHSKQLDLIFDDIWVGLQLGQPNSFFWGIITLYIPLVNVNKKLWKITIFHGKTHYKSPCSIAF
jgi:hypothetical protein